MTSAFVKTSAWLPIFIALALLLAERDVPGAETSQYLVEYQAFREALAAGNSDAAKVHARAAWNGAEKALGDDRVTAILAYNYGHLVLFDDSEDARKALSRARELEEAGVADLDADNLRLYADYADYAAGGYRERDADSLRKSLEAIETGSAVAAADLAGMWLGLAAGDIATEEFRKAQKSAASAESIIRLTEPDDAYGLAEATLLGGIARLVPYPRTVEEIKAAHDDFARGLDLFSPQDDIDGFDPLFAKLIAWDGAARAALETLRVNERPPRADSKTWDWPRLPKLFAYQQDASLDCGEIEWAEQTKPRFPFAALNRGNIGAVLVGFRLSDDLRIRDARVLAEVPIDQFGEGVLEAMTKWRVKKLPSGGPECHRNLVTLINFVIEK